MINYASENERSKYLNFLPPKKPAEIYPDDGPPPLTSMMNVTVHPNVKQKERNSSVRLHYTLMKELERDSDGRHRTSNGRFYSDIEKDEESQQMYGWICQNLFGPGRIFTVAG